MQKSRKTKTLLIFIIAGILCGLFIKLFVLDWFHVSGKSMESTLKDGSTVFVSKISYGLTIPFTQNYFFRWAEPQKNDIVIFLHDNKIVIKRCVLTGGEKLDFLADSQYSLIAGQYKIPLDHEQFEKLSQFEKVPEGYIFAVGDNYDQSIDSREYGFISIKNITGKVICR